jgi:hypothetical protein
MLDTKKHHRAKLCDAFYYYFNATAESLLSFFADNVNSDHSINFAVQL